MRRIAVVLLMVTACSQPGVPTADEMVELRKEEAARDQRAMHSLSIEGIDLADKAYRASALGQDARTFRVDWAECSQDMTEKMAATSDWQVRVRLLKFNRFECSDGKSTWSKTWP